MSGDTDEELEEELADVNAGDDAADGFVARNFRKMKASVNPLPLPFEPNSTQPFTQSSTLPATSHRAAQVVTGDSDLRVGLGYGGCDVAGVDGRLHQAQRLLGRLSDVGLAQRRLRPGRDVLRPVTLPSNRTERTPTA